MAVQEVAGLVVGQDLLLDQPRGEGLGIVGVGAAPDLGLDLLDLPCGQETGEADDLHKLRDRSFDRDRAAHGRHDILPAVRRR